MRICIVTPTQLGLTETFIRAHIDYLPHEIICLHGYALDYTWGDRKLGEWHKEVHGKSSGRWLNLLPRFLEFRMRRHFFPAVTNFEVTKDFLRSQKIDVVLAEYGTAAAFITPVCQSAGVPLVAHFHGFDASRFSTLEQFADAYKKMFDYASSIISVSQAMSKALVELGCPREKFCYNPYGPDSRFFEVRPNYSSHTLIAVGRHTNKKAPYLTLDAFRRAQVTCPELRLCMIGDGEMFEVSERLVKAWDLDEQVDLVGSADSDAIRRYMGGAFAFIQHSIQARDGDSEGTPVAILEAGAAGLPVISTRHAGIPGVVIEGKTGFLVDPGDTQAMAESIIQLVNNRTLVQTMGDGAREHVNDQYSMERHLGVLNDCLVQAAKIKS